ncbi:MAG: hypothetical protein DRO06_01085 [Thermoproteota archaeon]|nr:MAG: hypothetical protein DRO06_01085 [Candidatus Korarchaeota archaeon]
MLAAEDLCRRCGAVPLPEFRGGLPRGADPLEVLLARARSSRGGEKSVVLGRFGESSIKEAVELSSSIRSIEWPSPLVELSSYLLLAAAGSGLWSEPGPWWPRMRLLLSGGFSTPPSSSVLDALLSADSVVVVVNDVPSAIFSRNLIEFMLDSGKSLEVVVDRRLGEFSREFILRLSAGPPFSGSPTCDVAVAVGALALSSASRLPARVEKIVVLLTPPCEVAAGQLGAPRGLPTAFLVEGYGLT